MEFQSRIYLSPPDLSGSEIEFLRETLESNWVTQGGSQVDAFQKNIADYLGEDSFVAATTTGTAALHLALILLDVKPDDFVICQSFTFAASANPIKYLGASPVFVDSEKETWNLCPNALEDAIKLCLQQKRKPKAVIAVNLYGMPYQIEQIRWISQNYEIPVIEDAAESLGSKFKGKNCGTFGDIAILSFNGNKIITTSGGGALITKNSALRDRAIFLSTQAKDNANYYLHSELGYNYRMSNVLAALGNAQLQTLEQKLKAKKENHKFYQKLFSQKTGIYLHQVPSEEFDSNFWLNTVLINEEEAGITAEDMCKFLNQHEIESRPLWKPLHTQPFYSAEDYVGGEVAESLFKGGLCLPSGSNLNSFDKQRITEVFERMLQF